MGTQQDKPANQSVDENASKPKSTKNADSTPAFDSADPEARRAAELAEQVAAGGDSLAPQDRANAAIAGDLQSAGYVIKPTTPAQMDIASDLQDLGYAAPVTMPVNTEADVQKAAEAATAAGQTWVLGSDGNVKATNIPASDAASATDEPGN
jgi:hypothetical protein